MMKWTNQATPVNGAFPLADYNHYWNVTGNRYYCADGVNDPSATACNLSAYGTPGTHDQNINPMFMESTRNFLSWGKHLDPTLSTWADIIAKFAQVADNNYDSRFNILDLYNWIRAGFRPQNPAIWTAGSDGSYAGAVAPNPTFGSAAGN